MAHQFTEEQISAKIAESLYQMTRQEAIDALQRQAEHDASLQPKQSKSAPSKPAPSKEPDPNSDQKDEADKGKDAKGAATNKDNKAATKK